MKLLGFNFTKISAEKYSNDSKGVKINNNIDVSDIKEVNAGFLNNSGKVLSVFFTYSLSYDTNYAKVELGGKLIVSTDQETAEQILEKWKSKSIPNEFKTKVFNVILKKSDLKALQLEDEISIPRHLSLRKAKANQKNPQNE